jgi:transcriptional regulator with XRE-family HTH domain
MTAISESQAKKVEAQTEWLPARLKELRESAGFSREHVGNALAISAKRVWDIENGRYDIKWSTICRYCLVVGASMDKWLSGCPRAIDPSRLPNAVEKGQEFDYLLKLLDRTELDADQLRQVEKWAKDKRKAA